LEEKKLHFEDISKACILTATPLEQQVQINFTDDCSTPNKAGKCRLCAGIDNY